MIIRYNTSSNNAVRVFNSRQNGLQKSISQLSTGKRITSAGDDPAGFSISERLRVKVSSLLAAKQNAVDGISLLQTAEGYLSSVQSLLSNSKALAIQASNGIYSDSDRANSQLEFSQVIEELDRVENAAKFNGLNLLTGDFANPNNVENSDSVGVPPVSKALTLLVGVDASDKIDVYINAFNKEALRLTEVTLENREKASQALQFIDRAIETTNKQMVELGSYQGRLRNVIDSTAVAVENFKSAESNIRDTDISQKISELGRQLLGNQVNLAMISQANIQAQSVMRLFQ